MEVQTVLRKNWMVEDAVESKDVNVPAPAVSALAPMLILPNPDAMEPEVKIPTAEREDAVIAEEIVLPVSIATSLIVNAEPEERFTFPALALIPALKVEVAAPVAAN